jgi:hypothetical protein
MMNVETEARSGYSSVFISLLRPSSMQGREENNR